MKAIMVMFDSLNRRMLPPYGCGDVIAPNFTRLAECSVTFDTSYVGSMPCMPARRDLQTGRLSFLHRSWGPLEPFDDSVPRLLHESGIHTHLVSDHLHYWEDGGATYHQRFSTWEIVRGQEGDHWKALVDPPEPPAHRGQLWTQDYLNRQYMDAEEKQPMPQTFALGLDFLQLNKDRDNWFLQVETFDPHEPYYTQQAFKDLYPHEYDGLFYDWPVYGPNEDDEQTTRHLRCQYMALLTMCDKYLGKVLDFMDEYDMWKDTMLIVNTDHGFMLSEHDWWGKVIMPHYEEIARTPLFVYDPRCGAKGERRDALVQSIDLAPTLLEYFNVTIPEDMLGRPLRSVIAENTPIHEGVLFGQHGSQVNVTDGRYVYMRACATPDNKPLYQYTLMPTHMTFHFHIPELRTAELTGPFSFTKGCKVLRTDSSGFLGYGGPNVVCENPSDVLAKGAPNAEIFRNLLFDLKTDPYERNPLYDPELEERMIRLMVRLMEENDAPLSQFERLGLKDYMSGKATCKVK